MSRPSYSNIIPWSDVFFASSESILAFLHETTGDSFPEIKTPEVRLCANLLEEEVISRSKVDVQVLGNLNLIHRKIKSLRKDITIRDWRSDTTFVVSRKQQLMSLYEDTHMPSDHQQ